VGRGSVLRDAAGRGGALLLKTAMTKLSSKLRWISDGSVLLLNVRDEQVIEKSDQLCAALDDDTFEIIFNNFSLKQLLAVAPSRRRAGPRKYIRGAHSDARLDRRPRAAPLAVALVFGPTPSRCAARRSLAVPYGPPKRGTLHVQVGRPRAGALSQPLHPRL